MSGIVLITGSPGVGKSTLCTNLASSIGKSVCGFISVERRASGKRVGFDFISLDGSAT